MDNQILLDISRLVSQQSALLLTMMSLMLAGFVVLGVELYAIMRGCTTALGRIKTRSTQIQQGPAVTSSASCPY